MVRTTRLSALAHRLRADAFHPDLRAVSRVIPCDPFRPAVVRLLRAASPQTTSLSASDVEIVRLSTGAAVRIFRPQRGIGPLPALLWIHGGGYVLGSANQDDWLCRRFVATLDCIVVSVDYRLAPQHPYPAALDDCYAALLLTAGICVVDPLRIAIAGASAGGGLAAALALRARDRREVSPAVQVLVYPMLDDRCSAGSDHSSRDHRMWSYRSNRMGWSSYLQRADRTIAVPARAVDVSGLPPTWLGVGTADLFHAETMAYAARLRHAGVLAHVEVVPGAFHGFDLVARDKAVTRRFFAGQCAMLRSVWNFEPDYAPARHTFD